MPSLAPGWYSSRQGGVPLTYGEFQRILAEEEFNFEVFSDPEAFENPRFDMDANPIETVFLAHCFSSDIDFGPISDETDSRIQGCSPMDREFMFGVYAWHHLKVDPTFKALKDCAKAEDLPFYADLMERLEALAPSFVRKRREAGEPVIEKEFFSRTC
jgi:hypothetical protein